jgi:hypothetical protein
LPATSDFNLEFSIQHRRHHRNLFKTTAQPPHKLPVLPSSRTTILDPTNQRIMDSVSNSLAGVDLSKLSDRDKQELQQFVMNESQKARIQACMYLLGFNSSSTTYVITQSPIPPPLVLLHILIDVTLHSRI